MNATTAMIVVALVLVTASSAPAAGAMGQVVSGASAMNRASLATAPRAGSNTTMQLADMGMGELGPELGGSQGDMILDDPGKLPREPDMVVSDPGRLPREPDMVLDDPGKLPREPDMIVSDPGTLPPQPQMDIEQPQDLDSEDDLD